MPLHSITICHAHTQQLGAEWLRITKIPLGLPLGLPTCADWPWTESKELSYAMTSSGKASDSDSLLSKYSSSIFPLFSKSGHSPFFRFLCFNSRAVPFRQYEHSVTKANVHAFLCELEFFFLLQYVLGIGNMAITESIYGQLSSAARTNRSRRGDRARCCHRGFTQRWLSKCR